MTNNQQPDKPKAILADMDDTILNYTPSGEQCWKSMSQRFASRLDGVDASTFYKAIMEANKWFWSDPERHHRGRLNLRIARREPVAIALNKLGINNEKLVAEIAETFYIEREKEIKSFPGAIKTLKEFRNQGIKLALLSNGGAEMQRNKVKRFKLDSFFDHILIEGELGFGKPDYRVFKKALDLLQVTAEQAWMIGDDLERDIAPANKLGIISVWIDWKDAGLPAATAIRPDKIVRTISELQIH